jgi:hypothetical protein
LDQEDVAAGKRAGKQNAYRRRFEFGSQTRKAGTCPAFRKHNQVLSRNYWPFSRAVFGSTSAAGGAAIGAGGGVEAQAARKAAIAAAAKSFTVVVIE